MWNVIKCVILTGIISNENQDRVAICLKTAEKLIRSCPSTTVQEVYCSLILSLLLCKDLWQMHFIKFNYYLLKQLMLNN